MIAAAFRSDLALFLKEKGAKRRGNLYLVPAARVSRREGRNTFIELNATPHLVGLTLKSRQKVSICLTHLIGGGIELILGSNVSHCGFDFKLVQSTILGIHL